MTTRRLTHYTVYDAAAAGEDNPPVAEGTIPPEVLSGHVIEYDPIALTTPAFAARCTCGGFESSSNSSGVIASAVNAHAAEVLEGHTPC